MKTKRTKQNRKINRKTKQTRNKRIKYGAGDFRRRSEFSADNAKEAMRALTAADFQKGGLLSMESLIDNVAVLDIREKFDEKFAKLLEKELKKKRKIREEDIREEDIREEKIRDQQISIKVTGECMLETLCNHLQIGTCIRIGPNTNSRYRMGANNIVCIIEGDFTGKPKLALRVCMNRFPIDYISKTYLQELKIFVKLSQDEITPEVYYGGLCLTNNEDPASQQYHFYSLTEAFEKELFELYQDEVRVGLGQRILDITRDTVNDLIDKFSEYGMNCDCRSTNFVVNSSKNGEGQVIVTKMRMIDIDQSYFLSIGKLNQLFKTVYIRQYVDGDVETFASFAMKYLFWLEINLSGFNVAHEYLMELFHHMESNPSYKILFLFLFLNTMQFYKGIHVIYKIDPDQDHSFLFGDYAFSIIKSKIKEIDKTHIFTINEESNKKIIEEFHSILFPESKSVQSLPESKSVQALPESKSVQALPESK